MLPAFNFSVPNPQQQYFQPIPPSVFANTQQQQQPPFQFNPNNVNVFPTSVQQASRASPYTQDNHNHSHEFDSSLDMVTVMIIIMVIVISSSLLFCFFFFNPYGLIFYPLV